MPEGSLAPAEDSQVNTTSLSVDDVFPPFKVALFPVSFDRYGTPLYFARAILEDGIFMPCTVRVDENGRVECYYAHNRREIRHGSTYDLVPFDQETMELLKVWPEDLEEGELPFKPVEGGMDENGNPLWHAIGEIAGVRTPGYAGKHLVRTMFLSANSRSPQYYISIERCDSQPRWKGRDC